MRLAIIRTHPTQYFSPLYHRLATIPGLQIKVFYVLKNRGQGEFDPGFNQNIAWDVSLLNGYEYEFVEPSPLPLRPTHVFECRSPKLIKKLKEGNFDAIFCAGYSLWLDWQILIYALGNKIPLICRPELNEKQSSRGLIKTFLRTSFLQWYFSQVSAFLYIGKRAKEDYLGFGGDNQKAFFSPYAIDNSVYSQSNETATSKKQLQKQMGFENCQCVLLFAGKFIPQKGFSLLVEALKLIDPQIKLGLLIVGDGPERESSLKQLSQTKLEHVYFAGFQNQSNMPKFYSSADVLVVPSIREPWGLVVNEAMASGIPVIASNCVGAAYDLVEEGKTGYIFESNNPKALAHSVTQFMKIFSAFGFSETYIKNKVSSFDIENAAQGFQSAIQFIRQSHK